MVTKKEIEIFTSKLKNFENPKINLEQYEIDETFWSEIIYWFCLDQNIKNKESFLIYDFGAGTGKLSLPFLLCEFEQITFFEIDKDAINILKKNILTTKEYLDYNSNKESDSKKDERLKLEIVEQDISRINKSKINKQPDLIIMNPPYGTKKKGADLIFLEKALEFNCKIITMHKESTKEFISKKIKNKNRNFIVYDTEYLIKNKYFFHEKKNHKFKVSIFIIEKKEEK